MDSRQANRIAAFGIGVLPLSLFFFRVVNAIPYFGAVNDFPEYSTAAKLLLSGEASKIYRLPEFFARQSAQFPGMGDRHVALFLPPFDVPLLLPVALIPDAVAPIAWTIILFVILIAALLMLKRCYQLSMEHFSWFFGLTILSGPCIESVRIGQLSPLLLLCLTLTNMLCRQKHIIAGGVVFALMLLKPQQMWPLLVFFTGCRQYTLMKSVVLVLGVLGVISIFAFGMQGYVDYLNTVQDPRNIVLMAPALNATVRGQLLLLMGAASSIPNIVALIGLALSTVFVFLLGRRTAGRTDWFEFGLVGALPIGLVTSMHCHDYDLLLLVPSMLAIFAHPPFRQKWGAMHVLAIAGAILFSQPIFNEIHYNYLCCGGIVNPYFFLLLIFGLTCAREAWTAARAPES